MNRFAHFSVFAAMALATFDAAAQLRIVQYNTTGGVRAGFETDVDTVLRQIGNETVNGIAKPIDILTIQETDSQADVNSIRDRLNGLYGANTYVATTRTGTTSGGGLPAMIYRASAVQLLDSSGNPVSVTSGVAASGGSIAFGTVSTSANARSTLRYRVRPTGYTSAADFYVYTMHMKSSNTATDEARRNVEATSIRSNLDALGQGIHAIALGDYNFYGGSAQETGYATLLAAGNGRMVDPLKDPSINYPDNWSGNSSSLAKRYHTQSPATTAAYGGQITGGLDDRFDLQLSTEEFHDGEGLSFIAGSYRTFGINGTHALDAAVNAASNTWTATGLTETAAAVKTALSRVTDHLPVVADYQIPAAMTVSYALPSSTRLIKNSINQVTVTVTNSASVVAAAGADELDFTIAGTSVVGSINGTDAALGSGFATSVSLISSTVGAKSGNITVNSSSQAVLNGSSTQAVSYTVVDHANPSFSSLSDVDSTTIDFGYVPVGFAGRSKPLAISNLASPSGFTANLDIDAITLTGSTQFVTNILPQNNITPGSTVSGNILLTPTAAAVATRIFDFNVSDENIPGASGYLMPATATARVISAANFPVTGFMELFSGETYSTGPMSISTGVTLTLKNAGLLSVTGTQTHGSGATLIVEGSNAEFFTNTAGLNLQLTSTAEVDLLADAALSSLSIGAASVLRTHTSDLLVTYTGTSPLATLETYLTSGQLLPDGDFGGVPTVLVLAEASVLGYTEFANTAIAGNAVIGKYTYTGDANLDGQVDSFDYSLIDDNFGSPGSFITGDLNGDGIIDSFDYSVIDDTFGAGVGNPLRPALSPAANTEVFIPEPSSAALLMVSAGLLARRRR